MSTPSLTPKERQQIQQIKGTLQQQEDKKAARLGALARTLTSTDRILTGRRDLAVVFGSQIQGNGSFTGSHAHIPAYTDGKRIAINDAIIPDIRTKNGLVTTLGLNYHELAHNLFTPGSSSVLVSTARDEGIFSTFNLLEDQRIESLLVAKYRSAAKFLSAPVLEFIVKDENTWATAHLFVYGRRFIQKDVRKELRDVFNGSDRTRIAAESLIDEYRGMDLSSTRNHDRALEIVRDLHKILKDELNLTPDEQQAMDEHSGCGGIGGKHGGFTNSLMSIKEETKNASRRRDDDDAAQEEEEKEEEQPQGEDGEDVEDIDDEDGPEEQPEGDTGDLGDDSEDDDDDISDEYDDEDGDGGEDSEEDIDEEDGSDGLSGDEPEGDDEGSEGGSAGGPSGGDAGDVGDDGDASGDDSHGSVDVEDGADGGSGAGVGVGPDDLGEILAAALAELEGDSEVEEEVSRLQGAMDDDNLMDTLLADAEYKDQPVESDDINTASSVMRELQKLNTQFEAGWHYGSDHGRLNPQLAMTADWGDTDIFDHWEEGREQDAAVEAYITVDKSSSMSGDNYGAPDLIGSACKALWVVKRALDDVDGITTVTTFNAGDPEKLYGRGERADHNMVRQLRAQGGTNPLKAFTEGRRILNVSERPNKLFVVITDGEWSAFGINAGTAEKSNLAALNSIKGTRVYIGLGQKCEDVYREAFDVIAVIQKPSDIVEVIRKAVVSMLDEAIKRR